MSEKLKVDPRECAISCNYLNLEMEYPRTKGDVESFLWYLYHGVSVYIGKNGRWYLNARSRCGKLSKDKKCSVADRQPEVCAQHSGNGAKKLKDVIRYNFKNETELLAYLKEKRPALFKKLHPATRSIANGGGRSALKKSSCTAATASNCDDCGLCCTYLNITVDRPTSEEDVKTLMWYQYHKKAELYFDKDGDYSLVFNKRCEQLDENNLCAIYERRPSICRQFSAKNCHGKEFGNTVKAHFDTEETLIRFFKKKRPGLFKKMSGKLQALAP